MHNLINTKRLSIKNTSTEDIDLILKLDKQEITQKYLGGIKYKTKEERINFLSKKINSKTVFLNTTPIGFIELKINNNIGELSYIFDYDYTNKGYCTESCKEIILSAFVNQNIVKITANTIEDNLSSRRVLEKLNFKYKSTYQKDNKTFIEYELLKDDLIK